MDDFSRAFCPVRGGTGSSPPRPTIFPLWDRKPHKDEANLSVDIDTQQTQPYYNFTIDLLSNL